MAVRKALILDTSILCVVIGIPGKEVCGPKDNLWTQERVTNKLEAERQAGATLVLPLATVIETGNHIAQSKQGDRIKMAQELAAMMFNAASGEIPWAAFAEQQNLWNADALRYIAEKWPLQAAQGFSMGDFTIVSVADQYRQAGFYVEIFTGDQGLKAMEPIPPSPKLLKRRRRQRE
jgi:hypothetical protein